MTKHDRTFSREQVLDAFGVTEDDVAALEARDGYQAARAEAQREFDAFAARIEQLRRDLLG